MAILVRSRLLHMFVLLTQAFFLNVVVPCHTPGSIVLDGTKQAEAGFHLPPCCCCCGNTTTEASKKQTPTPYERQHCAICFLAAHTMPLAVWVFDLSFLKRQETALLPPPAVRLTAPLIRTNHCRGPPGVLV